MRKLSEIRHDAASDTTGSTVVTIEELNEIYFNLRAAAAQCDLAGDETVTGKGGIRIPVKDIAKCIRLSI